MARDFWAIWRKICKQIAYKAVRRALFSVSFIIEYLSGKCKSFLFRAKFHLFLLLFQQTAIIFRHYFFSSIEKKTFRKTPKKFCSFLLTNRRFYSIIIKLFDAVSGEVSEWFKELVLKTSDSARNRGFESHPLSQLNTFWTERFSWRFLLWIIKCGSTQVVKGLPC